MPVIGWPPTKRSRNHSRLCAKDSAICSGRPPATRGARRPAPVRTRGANWATVAASSVSGVPGVGETKLDRYGPAFLAVIADSESRPEQKGGQR